MFHGISGRGKFPCRRHKNWLIVRLLTVWVKKKNKKASLPCPRFWFLKRHSLDIFACSGSLFATLSIFWHLSCTTWRFFPISYRNCILSHLTLAYTHARSHTQTLISFTMYVSSKNVDGFPLCFFLPDSNNIFTSSFLPMYTNAICAHHFRIVLLCIYQLFVVISLSHIWSRNEFVGFSFIT